MHGPAKLIGGLDGIGPLRGKVSSVRVGFRPNEPLLEERIAGIFLNLRGYAPPEGLSISLGVRSVDGFFVTAMGSAPMKGEVRLVRVLDYDPIRQVFLVAGTSDPDLWAPVFWFGFKVFISDGIICSYGKGSEDPGMPEEPEHRNRLLLSLMSEWKEGNPQEFKGRTLYRCPTLEGLESHMISIIAQREVRSEGMSHRS